MEPVHHRPGGPWRPTASRRSSRPFNLPAYVLPFWTALGLDRGAQALGRGLRDVPARPRARHALRRGAAGRARLRAQPVDGDLAVLRPCAVWALLPWLLLLTERLVRRPGLLPGLRPGRRRGAAVPLRARRVELPRRCWPPPRSSRCGCGRRARRACAGAPGASRPRWPAAPRWRRSRLVPFLELLWHSADFRDRGGQSIDVHLRTQDALGLFLPDYWGRPTQTPLRPFLLERAFYVGALPLMLAGIALIVRPRAERVAIAAFGVHVLRRRGRASRRSRRSSRACRSSPRATTRASSC